MNQRLFAWFSVNHTVGVWVQVTAAAAAPLLLTACRPGTNSLTEERRAAIVDAAVSTVVNWLEEAVANHETHLSNSRLIWAEDGVFTCDRDSVAAVIRDLYASMQASRFDWGAPYVEVPCPDTAVVATTFRWSVTDTSGATSTIDGAWTAVVARTADGWMIVNRDQPHRLPQPM